LIQCSPIIISINEHRKKPFKRDQALNDATSGQFGEEPLDISEEHSAMQEHEDQRKKIAREFSKNI
jgi:hypothetical protein